MCDCVCPPLITYKALMSVFRAKGPLSTVLWQYLGSTLVVLWQYPGSTGAVLGQY